MKKIRIGNDVTIKWKVFVNGGKTFLTSFKNIEVLLLDSAQRVMPVDLTDIRDDTITLKLYGYKMLGSNSMWKTGNYSLELYINKNERGQAVADLQNAFALVDRTSEAGGDSQDVDVDTEIEIEPLSIAVGIAGSNGKSAYEIWLAQGNEGTEQDFLNSLKPAPVTLESLGLTIDTQDNTLTINGKSFYLTPVE